MLDKNGLASLAGLPVLASVSTLSFNNNEVDDMAAFLDSVAASIPSLAFLSLMRNPASPPMVQLSEEDVAAGERHRLYVVFRLPKLAFLDAAPVSAAERTEAAAKGRYLVTKRAAAAPSSPAAAASSPPAPPTEDEEAASAAEAGSSGRTMKAFLGVGKSTYDGKHSEGNRFIVNDDL